MNRREQMMEEWKEGRKEGRSRTNISLLQKIFK
jgi:hypothetical protein